MIFEGGLKEGQSVVIACQLRCILFCSTSLISFLSLSLLSWSARCLLHQQKVRLAKIEHHLLLTYPQGWQVVFDRKARRSHPYYFRRGMPWTTTVPCFHASCCPGQRNAICLRLCSLTRQQPPQIFYRRPRSLLPISCSYSSSGLSYSVSSGGKIFDDQYCPKKSFA